jgi:leader peptidase (prepilin peptidase) / N-methyltransferase
LSDPSTGSSDESTQLVQDQEVDLEKQSDAPKLAIRNRKRRWHWNKLLTGATAALFMLWLLYVLVIPLIEIRVFRWRYPSRKILPVELAVPLGQRSLMRKCEFLFVGWFFYFGASIGSFLNVVAGRLPAGRTIVFGGSKCPFCDARLSFIDNTPILGWLLLQGKCRTCRLPIAVRYLVIELIVGSIFVWLAWWQLISGGANLPHVQFGERPGLVDMVLSPNWPLIVATLTHAGLFAVLVMLAVCNEGTRKFPTFAFMVIVLLLAVPRMVLPELDFVAWYEPFLARQRDGVPMGLGGRWSASISLVMGTLTGAAVGWLSSIRIGQQLGRVVQHHWILHSTLIGSVLGWQAALPIVVCAGMIASITVVGTLRVSLVQAGLMAAGIVHHSMWKQIVRVMFWTG